MHIHTHTHTNTLDHSSRRTATQSNWDPEPSGKREEETSEVCVRSVIRLSLQQIAPSTGKLALTIPEDAKCCQVVHHEQKLDTIYLGPNQGGARTRKLWFLLPASNFSLFFSA